MYFVWSPWLIVVAVLIAGIVASAIIYFKMDKKDKAIIEDFVNEASKQAGPQSEAKVESEPVEKTEVVENK